MKTEYLIIGNSVAGINCIEAIREIDREGVITVVSEENILNYSRPLISYYLGGKVSLENMYLRDERFYEDNRVDLILNRRVEKISVVESVVKLSNRRKIPFQKLLLACGGKPIIPLIERLENITEGIFTFTKLEDAKNLIDYIESNKIENAIVLGAGLIGLKCVEGLVERKLRVTIIELANRILANTFDPEASIILESALRKQNCSIIKENTIARVKGKGGKLREVMLKTGKLIPTNLLIIAVGVKPNLDLLEDTPIKYEQGILVDDFMQTNVRNIYAAGDAAQGKDFLLQKKSLLPIWPVAARQGKVAGFNMAGREKKYEGLFIMNSVELAGIPTISFGITNPPESHNYEILLRKNEGENFYRKLVLRNNRIVGGIFLGKIERAGIFSGLIKNEVNVSSFKNELLSDQFGLLVLPEEYRKHLVTGEGIEV